MKKLLLIAGDLATGKSTFANILSKRYDANVFYKDSIKDLYNLCLEKDRIYGIDVSFIYHNN